MRYPRFLLLGLLTLAALLLAPVPAAHAFAVFTVDSTGDGSDSNPGDGVCDDGAGNCTLRAAIEEANHANNPGLDTIDFNIAGGGPHTISPGSALPTITDPVTIDGTSEPDFAGSPIIELDGSGAGAGVDGLNITAGDSTVKGLVINRFSDNAIELSTNGGNTIQRNYIGTDVTGTADLGNSLNGVLLNNVPSNTIGGTAGTSPGGSCTGACNVISGNNGHGVSIIWSGATGNTVEGNYIGTDVTATARLGNAGNGVYIRDAPSNTIGGTAAGARNVISANGMFGGVLLWGFGVAGNQVQGNFIGTDVTGTADLGSGIGVGVVQGASNNTIGGTEAGAGNVISGNDKGVAIGAGCTGNEVQGNYIGTQVDGTSPLGNWHGVLIFGSYNTIGGTAAGAGNVISGNHFDGVEIDGGGFPPGIGNTVQGNYIGTDVNGTAALGNTGDGVVIVGDASGSTIGGAAPGAGNTIAFNGGDGVYVESGTGNLVGPNSIHSNTGLGIDLGTDGVTPNDTRDPDTGPNNLQNFPVLTSATTSGSSTHIDGSLNSTPDTQFTIEFFSNTACDPSDHGEGESFVGSTTETTDGSGDVSFSVSFGTTVPAGHFITATATDPNGNTSEFSECEEVLLDSDGDGVPDIADNCPNTANSDQENTDGDQWGDACDNCPDTANPGQENNVHPGTPEGDHCEDFDGDGYMDAFDACPDLYTHWLTPIGDGDCDGFTSDDEGSIGTDPNLACGLAAWPPDFDDSNWVDIFDVNMMKPAFFSSYPGPPYDARLDLKPDNGIDVYDVNRLKPSFFLSCTP